MPAAGAAMYVRIQCHIFPGCAHCKFFSNSIKLLIRSWTIAHSWNPSEENRKRAFQMWYSMAVVLYVSYDLRHHASYLIRHLNTAEIGLSSSFLLHSPLLASLAIVYTISLVVRCHAAAALEQMWRDIFDAWATAWFKSWWRLCRRGIHCGSGWWRITFGQQARKTNSSKYILNAL